MLILYYVWEQERLGKISNFSTGKGITISQSLSKGFPIVSGGIDVMGYYSKYNRMENTITIARAGKCGYVSFISEKFYLNDKCFSLDLKENINSYFLFNLLKKNEKRIMELGSNSSIPTITSTSLKAVDIFRTSYDEQKAIAILFVSINSLIALHQRELKILKIFKKSLFQKMIVGKNLTILPAALTKMTNVWEQEKIGNIFTITRGYVLGKEKISLEKNAYFKYPVFSSQTKSDGLMGYYNSYLFDKAITWTTDGIYAGDVNYRDEKFYCTNVCGVLLNNDGYINLCNAISINKVSKKHVTKVGNPKLMNNVMKEILFSYSNNLKEQTNISIIFNNINSLITLHQRELKILKIFKKSLLQKMIVGKNLTILPAKLTKMTNVWEQERFNNLYIFASEGGTPSTFVEEYYKNGKIPFVKIEDTLKKYIYSTKNFITELGLNKSSAWIIKKDNIIFTNGATVGNISINKIDLSTKQGILGIILKENFNVEFIYYLLNTINFKNKINQIKTKGTFDILTLNNIDTIKINIINNKNEQLNISNLLSKIDSLITLHQRELKILKIFKKSLFVKMIVGKNLTILPAKLTKMTNVWEQERLGDLCEISTGKLNANAMVECGKYDFYTSGIEKFKINSYAFKGPAITVAGNGASMGYLHLADNFFNAYQRTYVLTKIGINRVFLYYLLFTLLPKKINDEACRGSIPYIVYDMLSDLKIVHPNFKEENKLGHLFDNINSLITLHQRELKILKIFKKSLFVKMIVGKNLTILPATLTKMTNAWEQERFNLLFRFVCKKGFKNLPILAATKENGMQKRQDINFNVQFNLDNIIKYKLVEPGQFVIHLSSYDSGLAHSTILGVTSPAYSVVDFINKENNDDKFWTFILKSKSFIDKLSSISYGLRVGKSINLNELNNIHLKSTNLIEQNKISKLFSLLNSLITLHQRGQFRRENEKKIRNFVL
ncbi:restriction endonuclease subunit S [Mycoplasmopsis cynos]|uniref:restriction endonuclease subunit S n=1 Tax=Mycoplasmopsis cynos TaxID=171284 RepID=UPI002B0009CC|nr:restriction endonuclease subunit S [Mycoplasmopsis cynos]WQQ17443.1 restriction endonuclease subunit S [Mycoplasmopsis cynos]